MPLLPADDALPPIGPHEGIEFALMRAGRKHVALFVEVMPDGLDGMARDPDFAPIRFDRTFEKDGRAIPVPYAILHRRTHATDAAELHRLVTAPGGVEAARERRIGIRLGYPGAAVEQFVVRTHGPRP